MKLRSVLAAAGRILGTRRVLSSPPSGPMRVRLRPDQLEQLAEAA
jgi:hypothetical protein